jgi:hypothetical protein
MPRRVAAVEGPPELSDRVTRLLLGGYGSVGERDENDQHDQLLFTVWANPELLGPLWTRHEAYLRRRAVQWQWRPCWFVLEPNVCNLRFVVYEDDDARPRAGPFYFAQAHHVGGPQRMPLPSMNGSPE